MSTEDAGSHGIGPDGKKCNRQHVKHQAEGIGQTNLLRDAATPSLPAFSPTFSPTEGVGVTLQEDHITGQTLGPVPVRQMAEAWETPGKAEKEKQES